MIACILVPHFPAAVERRRDPSLAAAPLVIGGRAWEPGKVYAASGEAARAGVKPGMPLRQAHTLCPEARFVPADRRQYQAAYDDLLDILAGFASRVEPDDPRSSVTYLDLGPYRWADAVEMVQLAGQAVRDGAGLAPAVGLAGGKLPARVAAGAAEADEGLLIAPGCEGAFLAPFPITLLPFDVETARRLQRLGIRTLGQLAALPSSAVLAQLGKEGHALYQMARGHDPRPVLPYSPRAAERAVRRFADPVSDRAILEAVGRVMLEDLAAHIGAAGLAARELRLSVEMEDGTTWPEEYLFRQPAAGVQSLGRALDGLLARVAYPCGVTGLDITLAGLVPAAGQQLDLFAHQTRQESRLRESLKDLVARYGAGRFFRASIVDRAARLPERRFRLQEVGEK